MVVSLTNDSTLHAGASSSPCHLVTLSPRHRPASSTAAPDRSARPGGRSACAGPPANGPALGDQVGSLAGGDRRRRHGVSIAVEVAVRREVGAEAEVVPVLVQGGPRHAPALAGRGPLLRAQHGLALGAMAGAAACRPTGPAGPPPASDRRPGGAARTGRPPARPPAAASAGAVARPAGSGARSPCPFCGGSCAAPGDDAAPRSIIGQSSTPQLRRPQAQPRRRSHAQRWTRSLCRSAG